MSIRELRFILDAISCCDSNARMSLLIDIAKDVALNIQDKNNAELIWLHSRFPLLTEDISLPKFDVEKLLIQLLLQSSNGGCREAQYEYGCILFDAGKKEKANSLYEQSANQGYPPAQWVFGSELLKSDFEKGKMYITLSAGQNYEYAIDFLINSYKSGQNGFDKNMKELEKWILVKSYNCLICTT